MDVRKSKKNAFADGTRKNFATQWKAYLMFCLFFKFEVLPVNSEVLCLFAQFLSRSFKSIDSVRNYISGVKCLARLFVGQEFSESFDLKLILRGLRKAHLHVVKQADPITPELLCKICVLLDFRNSFDCTWWCCAVFMFFLMARKSNMMPLSQSSFDANCQLLRRDVCLLDNCLMVHLKWSKTNQYGARKLVLPLTRIDGSCLCPCLAFERMCKLVKVSGGSPAFIYFLNGKQVILVYSVFQNKLRSLILKLGLNASSFSSHSFRRGGASWAFRSGVASELIQMHGDWVSDAYKLYVHVPVSHRLMVSRLMAKGLV